MRQAQAAFTHWRAIYNHERPHEALSLLTPAARYRMSARAYPQPLPDIEYTSADTVAVVKNNGEVRFKGHQLRVSSALLKLPIAFKPDPEHDGAFDVLFATTGLCESI